MERAIEQLDEWASDAKKKGPYQRIISLKVVLQTMDSNTLQNLLAHDQLCDSENHLNKMFDRYGYHTYRMIVKCARVILNGRQNNTNE